MLPERSFYFPRYQTDCLAYENYEFRLFQKYGSKSQLNTANIVIREYVTE
jgi:hypothetical protein